MNIGYGYRRKEADLVEAGADPAQIYIDMARHRPLRDDLLLAVRRGDVVIVLYARDLGGSPVADRVWRERIEAKGATVREVRPEKPPAKIGRPRKWTPESPEQERQVRDAWLGGGSEVTRLRRAAEAAGVELGKGLLTGRYGTPSNPKHKEQGDG